MDVLETQPEDAAKDHANDFTAENVPIAHMLPERPENALADLPESFRDLTSYYRTTRAFHPRAPITCLPISWDLMTNFDEFAHNDMNHIIHMISPRALLTITGTNAATKWYSGDGVAKAKEPRNCLLLRPDSCGFV